MPRSPRVSATDVEAIVRAAAFGTTPTSNSVGIEAEVLPIGRDGRRVPIRGPEGMAAVVDEAFPSARVERPAAGAPTWDVAGGRLTFEPGGQLEFSTPTHDGPRSAIDLTASVLGRVAAVAAHRGIVLASAGVDVWTGDDVPQQLRAPRYEAMDAYLGTRGPAGHRMMRHTCSLQVNVDPGVGDVAERRWRLTNLLAPLLAATFACSPAAPPDPGVSVRARTWRNLDRTRTGIPNGPALDGPVDRVADMTAFALAADVLLLRCPDGTVLPGRRGFSLGDWIAVGHPRAGWPTEASVREHLTTLFTEVRPRGPLEVRSIDAIPARWRVVPVVLLAGLLGHQPAGDHALGLLEPTADRVADRLARAGEVGLKDPEFCAETVEVWSYARAGAAAQEGGAVTHEDLVAVDAFIDRFTLRGLSPSDELRDLLARDRVDALAWAAEPHVTTVRV